MEYGPRVEIINGQIVLKESSLVSIDDVLYVSACLVGFFYPPIDNQ